MEKNIYTAPAMSPTLEHFNYKKLSYFPVTLSGATASGGFEDSTTSGTRFVESSLELKDCNFNSSSKTSLEESSSSVISGVLRLSSIISPFIGSNSDSYTVGEKTGHNYRLTYLSCKVVPFSGPPFHGPGLGKFYHIIGLGLRNSLTGGKDELTRQGQ